MTEDDWLDRRVPMGCTDPDLVRENLRLLDAFADGEMGEAELVAYTQTLVHEPAAVMAFVTAFESIHDRMFEDFRTIRLSRAPEREFLEWGLVSVGELRGFLIDTPLRFNSYFAMIQHEERSTCILAVNEDEMGRHLWDSHTFVLEAPVLALAVMSLHCRSVAYDVRASADVPDFAAIECLRESAEARQAIGPIHTGESAMQETPVN